MLYWIVRSLAWVVFRTAFALFGGLRVEGRENVPRRGGVLVAPNHISDADPPAMGVATPRGAWFMAKSELFGIPLLGPLMRLLRSFPVRRGEPDRAALRRAQQLLQSGEAVIVFPEGQCSETGTFQPLNPGVVLIALHGGAPVVPVGIAGTNRMLPYGKLVPRRAGRRIVVRYGPPISPERLSGGLSGRAALDHGVDVLTRAIAALLEPSEAPRARPEGPAAEADALAEGRNCGVS